MEWRVFWPAASPGLDDPLARDVAAAWDVELPKLKKGRIDRYFVAGRLVGLKLRDVGELVDKEVAAAHGVKKLERAGPVTALPRHTAVEVKAPIGAGRADSDLAGAVHLSKRKARPPLARADIRSLCAPGTLSAACEATLDAAWAGAAIDPEAATVTVRKRRYRGKLPRDIAAACELTQLQVIDDRDPSGLRVLGTYWTACAEGSAAAAAAAVRLLRSRAQRLRWAPSAALLANLEQVPAQAAPEAIVGAAAAVVEPYSSWVQRVAAARAAAGDQAGPAAAGGGGAAGGVAGARTVEEQLRSIRLI